MAVSFTSTATWVTAFKNISGYFDLVVCFSDYWVFSIRLNVLKAICIIRP